MPIFIEANYAKKIGLPDHSSHQFAVTLRTELGDLSQLEKTSAELYARLQQGWTARSRMPVIFRARGRRRLRPNLMARCRHRRPQRHEAWNHGSAPTSSAT